MFGVSLGEAFVIFVVCVIVLPSLSKDQVESVMSFIRGVKSSASEIIRSIYSPPK